MFSVNEVPWHGLGVILQEPPTSAEAIIQAGLNWPVEKRPVYFKRANDLYDEVQNRKALVRIRQLGEGMLAEDLLAVVSDNYEPLQNIDAFTFFDPLIVDKSAVYETAGSLREGRKIWILANLKSSSKVSENDELRHYLLLCNGHDGQTGVTVMLTTVRVVCNNTLTQALQQGGAWTTRHTAGVTERLEAIKQLLGLVQRKIASDTEHYRKMHDTPMTDEQFTSFIEKIFGKAELPPAEEDLTEQEIARTERAKERNDARMTKFLEIYRNGPGAEPGTVWGALNAVTHFVDFYMGGRAKDRVDYALFGRAAALKDEALEEALALIGEDNEADLENEDTF